MESGLVTETRSEKSSRGRPPIYLELNNDAYRTVGLYVVRGYMCACTCNLAGKTDKILEDYYTFGNTAEMTHKALELTKKLVARIKGKAKLLGIGISVPRFYGDETDDGKVLAQTFESKFDCRVFVENDAVCAALNEYHFNIEEKPSVMCHIVNYTGVGSAVLHNGLPSKGSHGLAGEIGHISIDPNGELCRCKNRGCLENYCSTTALERYYSEITNTGKKLSTEEILELVNNNDEAACKALDKVCSYLAIGIISISRMIDPDVVVVSDKLAIAHEFLRDKLEKYVFETVSKDDLKVVVRPYDNKAMLKGANANVLCRALDEPMSFFDL